MEARAFGKVILAGEHAVVYGAPAIAIGIDRGARARAVEAAAGPSVLRLAGWDVTVTENDDDKPLGRALAALLASVRSVRKIEVVSIEADTDLPAGAGLGCSAALGVAIARAVATISGDVRVDDDEARAHAMAWERVFHGNPSGVDAAVAALGGTIVFSREDDRSTVEPILTEAPLVVAVGHSGMASSTRTMVESVARQRTQRPDVVKKTFDGIAAVVRNARLAIEAGDLRGLGKLLDLNQMLLAGLLLSTQEIEAMCTSARDAGALGAKLTGAGGGGCVVALVESRADAERVLTAWKRDGFEGFIASSARDATRDASPSIEAAP